MIFLIPFFLGFATALPGIMLPGLINMTAAKVNLKEGKKYALIFVFGALCIITIQIFLAIFFARVINSSPEVVVLLREIGLAIFSALTFYFLFIAKKPKIKKPKIKTYSKKSRFFLGMLLAALNLFPIPYYVFASVALVSYHLISFNFNGVVVFVTGAVVGTFFGFYLYIIFFKKIESKSDFLLRNINTIMGSITAVVSIVTLINILKYYWF